MKGIQLRTIGAIVCVFYVCHLSSSPALGNTVLLTDNRYVSTNGSWRISPFSGTPSSGSWNLSSSPLSEFANFNSKVVATPNPIGGPLTPERLDVFAEQISSITSTDFEAVGTAHINVNMNVDHCSSTNCSMQGNAASFFEVGFTLLESHDFQLTSAGLVGHMYLAEVGVGTILTVPHSDNYIQTTGILHPGSYVLHADDTGSFGVLNGEVYSNVLFPFPGERPDPNYYHLSFQIQPAPEPPVIILLGVSLLSLAGLIRSAKQH